MLRALLKGQIDKMERAWGYDADYMRFLLRASPTSFLKFGFVSAMVDRKAAPADCRRFSSRRRLSTSPPGTSRSSLGSRDRTIRS